MARVRLTRTQTINEPPPGEDLRTESVEGSSRTWPPIVGEPFLLEAEGLTDKAKTRFVSTTPIEAVLSSRWSRFAAYTMLYGGEPFAPTEYTFRTRNSVYRAELLPDAEQRIP